MKIRNTLYFYPDKTMLHDLDIQNIGRMMITDD